MSVLVAILLGLLQGVTVFLPVSYSGHQAVFVNLLKLDVPSGGPFNFLMNVSTLISILMVYRKEVGRVLHEGIDFMRGSGHEDPMSEGRMSPSFRTLAFIILGQAPLLLTLPITSRIDILMNNAVFVGFAMIATGVLLFITDRFVKAGKKTDKTMSAMDVIFVGIGQAIAVIPGLSRIGTTMAVGQACGFKKEFSIRFSIFMALPSVAVAILVSFLSLFKSGSDWSSFFSYLLAFIISVFTGVPVASVPPHYDAEEKAAEFFLLSGSCRRYHNHSVLYPLRRSFIAFLIRLSA